MTNIDITARVILLKLKTSLKLQKVYLNNSNTFYNVDTNVFDHCNAFATYLLQMNNIWILIKFYLFEKNVRIIHNVYRQTSDIPIEHRTMTNQNERMFLWAPVETLTQGRRQVELVHTIHN